MYVQIETQKLRYLPNSKEELRIELYNDIHAHYYDTMTTVRTYGRPILFITMMCNPNSSEIKALMIDNNATFNRQDLTTKSFRAKFQDFRKTILEKEIFVQHCSTQKHHNIYIYIWHNKIQFVVPPGNDNIVTNGITNFRDARWVSPPELTHMYLSTYQLPLHLPNHHLVHFNERQSFCNILRDLDICKTKLTMCFEAYMDVIKIKIYYSSIFCNPL
ncbi:hypothetical protein AMTRI_Chr05g62960 [Amborella trichopoda]